MSDLFLLWDAAFGLLGVYVRYCITVFMTVHLRWNRIYASLTVNMVGCLAIGIVQAYAVDKKHGDGDLINGIITGFLGGLTTFSSYALDGYLYLTHTAPSPSDPSKSDHPQIHGGILYLAGSVVLGIGLTAASYAITIGSV
eukprot:ANDGO_01149.mRNA.1 Putative fluoride ion transporter CrcB